MSAELVPRLLEVWGETAHVLFAAHNICGSYYRASTVYTCLTFSVLSKTMVLLSATVVQGRCGLLSWEVYEVHSDAM